MQNHCAMCIPVLHGFLCPWLNERSHPESTETEVRHHLRFFLGIIWWLIAQEASGLMWIQSRHCPYRWSWFSQLVPDAIVTFLRKKFFIKILPLLILQRNKSYEHRLSSIPSAGRRPEYLCGQIKWPELLNDDIDNFLRLPNWTSCSQCFCFLCCTHSLCSSVQLCLGSGSINSQPTLEASKAIQAVFVR